MCTECISLLCDTCIDACAYTGHFKSEKLGLRLSSGQIRSDQVGPVESCQPNPTGHVGSASSVPSQLVNKKEEKVYSDIG